jgi:hypothetical protein
MKVDGCEFNPETNGTDLREKKFDVGTATGRRYTICVRMSAYIFGRMKDSDWNRCREETQAHVDKEVERGLRQGWAFGDRAQAIVGHSATVYAKQWVYNAFSKMQESAGDMCWAVSEPLEGVHVVR